MKIMKRIAALLVVLMGYSTAQAVAADEVLTSSLDRALQIIEADGYSEAAQDKMKAEGLTALDTSGLHIFAIDPAGQIVFDLSGQTTPGLDLKGVMDMEGKETVAYAREAANGKNGNLYTSQGSWPHPTSGLMIPSSMYCKLHSDNVVCAMIWHP